MPGQIRMQFLAPDWLQVYRQQPHVHQCRHNLKYTISVNYIHLFISN